MSSPVPMGELLIAVNPDPDSRLPYLLRVPLGAGMVFRTQARRPSRGSADLPDVPPNGG